MNNSARHTKLNIASLAIPAAVCVIICAFILTGITFSWFSSNVSAATNVVKSGAFTSTVTINTTNTTENQQVSELFLKSDGEVKSITIPADTSYSFLVIATSSIDGGVQFSLKVGDKYIGAWNTRNMNFNESQTIVINNNSTDPVDIKLDNCWKLDTSLKTINTDSVNITVYTSNSVAAASMLNNSEAATFGFFAAQYVVCPDTGLLHEVYSDTYYRVYDVNDMETWKIVEPTTGFEYNDEGYLVHPVTGRTCYIDELGEVYDVEMVGYKVIVESGNLIHPELGFEVDALTMDIIHPVTLKHCYLDENGLLIDIETGLEVALASGNLIDPTTRFEIDADGNIIHGITGKLCYFNEIGQLIDAETGAIVSVETGNLIDAFTGFEIDPATGYFIHGITGKLCYFNEVNQLIEAETGSLIALLTGNYIDIFTGFEIDPATGYFIHNENGMLCCYNEFGILVYVETGLPVFEEEPVEDPDEDVVEDTNEPDTAPDETVPVVDYIEGYARIFSTNYHLAIMPVVDDFGGIHWYLINGLDNTLVDLNPAVSAEYIDPVTGFYVIPGTDYRVVPATGYIYDSLTGAYYNPITCELASPADALGMNKPTEPEVTEPDSTVPEVTEPDTTEPEVTEPEVTEPETTEPEVTEPEVTEPEATEPEITEPEVTEPAVTEPEATESETTEPVVTEPEVTE